MASALSTLEGTSLSLMIMTIFETFNGTAGWHIIDRPALDLDNVTLKDVWLAMAAYFPVFLIVIWYLANALPTLREIPRPFYFPVMLSYWRPVHPTPRAGRPMKAKDANLFESAPEGAKAVISVEALTKVYGSSKALANVDLEIYEGQLTVLLGQNGAGKTSLINIIAGLQRATVGIVRVRGNDPTINVAAVRETMSFCPQKNFNFSDMTVREHLIYFGKGPTPSAKLAGSVDARPNTVTAVFSVLDWSEASTVRSERSRKER
ncbi:ATP-binding cassette sub-family A member 2-like [Ixodes scapularis]